MFCYILICKMGINIKTDVRKTSLLRILLRKRNRSEGFLDNFKKVFFIKIYFTNS